ncbi:MAG: DUF547 domain-containing protein, partial [Bacteroidota bacterium]
LDGLSAAEKQAFYINAYNLLVIEGAASNYPLKSVLDIGGFFDAKKKTVAGKKMTLNQLEKDRLLKVYKDARFHFVLVCGAIGCPPITNFAYRPETLEQQLATQTRKALNDPSFIRVDNSAKTVKLSQIFEWYPGDFGGSKSSAIEFINRYRNTAIPSDYKISFYTYDWTVNAIADANTGAGLQVPTNLGNNASRYVVSATIPKGTTETKIFNNLYTQQTGGGDQLTERSTFFTSIASFLYGVNDRFNAGFDLRYRRVRNEALPSSPFSVLIRGNEEGVSARQGVTTIGPKIRWAPLRTLPNFSVQSAFWITLDDDFEGTNELPFIDWNGASWFTQIFNDIPLGDNFSIFTELDIFWEDIGSADDDLNRFSTPVTAIFSYFPNPKTTIYGLTSYSPYWQADFDYFAQAGVGAKYQITPNFELELLYTAFTNEFLQDINGRASTFNFGIRLNR